MTDQQWENLLRILDGELLSPLPTGFLVDGPWVCGINKMRLMDYFTDTQAWLRANLNAVGRFPDVLWLPGFWAEFGMISNPPSFGAKCIWPQDGFPTCEPVPEKASDYDNLLDLFRAIDDEILYQPEYFYSSFEEDTSVACTYGGSFTFGPSASGENLTFQDCAYIQGFVLNGSGTYDYNSGLYTIEAEVSGDKSGTLTYENDHSSNSISVTGEYGGQTIDLQQ